MEEPKRKVLVVEDEVKIAEVVKSILESKGFFVICTDDGRKAVDIFRTDTFSFVLLDLMLPGMPGEEVCRIIRRESRVPIIMLTAKSSEADMLKGLGIGADDYIVKPFSLKSLLARMEAVLRRAEDDLTPMLHRKTYFNGDLTVDFDNRIAYKNSEEIKLTPNEYKILKVLISHPNKVFTREDLIFEAFGNDFDGFDRTIDSHIKNLRSKIESNSKNPVYIKTIHGVGYKFGGE